MPGFVDSANYFKFTGWIQIRGDTVVGKITFPAVLLPKAQSLVGELLAAEGGDVTMAEAATDRFRQRLQGMKLLNPLTSEQLSTVPNRGIWCYLGEIDHRGELFGWGRNASDPANRLTFAVSVDGDPIGTALADGLRLDLLRKGLGDGEHAFSIQFPDKYLDGAEHVIRAEVEGDPSATIYGARQRKLVTPVLFASRSTPWRRRPAEDDMLAIKSRIIDGDAGAVSEFQAVLEANPDAIFFDCGLKEAWRRRNLEFPTFRDRLTNRLLGFGMGGVNKPLISRFTSKAFTKEYCDAKGLGYAKTLLVSGSFDEIASFPFPARFVIKPVVDSGVCTYLYSEGLDLFMRRRVSMDQILAAVRNYLDSRPSAQFVVEELLVQVGSAGDPNIIPLDYKLHTFGGKVRLVHVDDRNNFRSRDRLYRQQGWFSSRWGPAPHRMRLAEEEAIDFAVPRQFDEMVRIAERVGRDCADYVRVDLYDSEEGIMLGEVTTFSHSGLGFTEFGDYVLSQAWEVNPATR